MSTSVPRASATTPKAASAITPAVGPRFRSSTLSIWLIGVAVDGLLFQKRLHGFRRREPVIGNLGVCVERRKGHDDALTCRHLHDSGRRQDAFDILVLLEE